LTVHEILYLDEVEECFGVQPKKPLEVRNDALAQKDLVESPIKIRQPLSLQSSKLQPKLFVVKKWPSTDYWRLQSWQIF
jgi:hypothetical protein